MFSIKSYITSSQAEGPVPTNLSQLPVQQLSIASSLGHIALGSHNVPSLRGCLLSPICCKPSIDTFRNTSNPCPSLMPPSSLATTVFLSLSFHLVCVPLWPFPQFAILLFAVCLFICGLLCKLEGRKGDVRL